MSQLIFDIETYGYDFDKLDSVIQKTLLKNITTDEEKGGVMARTGLLPISGEIVAIGMLNPGTNQGRVYFQSPQRQIDNYEKDNIKYIILKNEKEILEKFWQDVSHYQQLITFNGRGFDCPFIIFRSIIHNIKPNRNLMPNRYYKNEHLDLMDWLSFYNAFRPFSLEVLCQTFAIKNPKDQGVSGLAINDLFKNKEYEKIAEYCMRDVEATKKLYEKVFPFLF